MGNEEAALAKTLSIGGSDVFATDDRHLIGELGPLGIAGAVKERVSGDLACDFAGSVVLSGRTEPIDLFTIL